MKSSLNPSNKMNGDFNLRANASEQPARKAHKRRPPLSVRLSDGQWEQLEQDSDGMSYGAYVKERLFKNKRQSKRSAVQDYELLARILAALGQSEVFGKLDTLIELSERGELHLSPEAEFELGLACTCIIEMRDELVRALGLKPRS